MSTTASRCDQIIALIDDRLAEVDAGGIYEIGSPAIAGRPSQDAPWPAVSPRRITTRSSNPGFPAAA
jgi:hypothetical protein